jgi:hypothetical protein
VSGSPGRQLSTRDSGLEHRASGRASRGERMALPRETRWRRACGVCLASVVGFGFDFGFGLWC